MSNPIYMQVTPITGTRLHRRIQGGREIGPAYCGDERTMPEAYDNAEREAGAHGYNVVCVAADRLTLWRVGGTWYGLQSKRVFDQMVMDIALPME